jgi:DnaJ-domain-containing protein 1
MFAANSEGEGTAIYSSEEVGTGVSSRSLADNPEAQGFTVERAAEVIRNLPPEVPRPAAVRIVRGTLEAAGIDIAELASSTRARESKLNSEIDLSEGRIQKLKDETEEVIRSLEDEIRKAREARNFGVAEEERKIAAAESGLEDVDRVRDFFGLPYDAAEAPADDPAAGEETQVLEGADEEEDDTQVLRRPGPPLRLRRLLGYQGQPGTVSIPRRLGRLAQGFVSNLQEDERFRERTARGPRAQRGPSEAPSKPPGRALRKSGAGPKSGAQLKGRPPGQADGSGYRSRPSGRRGASTTFIPRRYPPGVLAAYNRLGLSPGAPMEEVDRKRRELVKRFHPDRYSDPDKRARAERVTAEINAAHDAIERHLTKGR